MAMKEIEQSWHLYRERIDNALLQGIDPDKSRLAAAMHYSLSVKGKRLRPLLFFTTVDALGEDPLRYIDVAACIEIIHTYSLIHDDLPCMDDDDFRRGMPTVHRKFDEAMALLAGDTLLTWAFERLADAPALEDAQKVALMKLITHAIGVQGMAGGQGLDLAFRGRKEDIPDIHRMKTAELIRASVSAGALVCRRQDVLPLLERSAMAIGLAFQLADDLLDVVGDPELVGKKLRKDGDNNSPNAVLHLGMDQVKAQIETLHRKAVLDLEAIAVATPAMKALYAKMAFRTS